MPEANYTYDSGWLMKATGLIGATAAVATEIDTGSATAGVKGEIVIDVSAIETDTGDEIYDIVLQGTTVAAFGTDTAIHDLCAISLGGDTGKRTDCNKDDVIGRYLLPFTNEAASITYRYLRLYTVVAGTIVTGINYTAFASVSKS